MNIDTFDLNLLRVLDAVMTERSISRAAERLHLTQPAVSHSLRRLRQQLDDPLIERIGRTMHPTPEGQRLAHEARAILVRVEQQFSVGRLDQPTTRRRFALAAADPIVDLLGGALVDRIRGQAPNALIEIQRLHSVRTPAQLSRRRLDVAISPAGSLPTNLRSAPLLALPWRPAVARTNTTVPAAMSVADLVEFPHAIVTRARVNDVIDASLSVMGLRRTIAISVDSDVLLPGLLTGTDLVAMTPIPQPETRGLRTIKIPTVLATTIFHLWWSPAAEGDPTHGWLVDQLMAVAGALADAE